MARRRRRNRRKGAKPRPVSMKSIRSRIARSVPSRGRRNPRGRFGVPRDSSGRFLPGGGRGLPSRGPGGRFKPSSRRNPLSSGQLSAFRRSMGKHGYRASPAMSLLGRYGAAHRWHGGRLRNAGAEALDTGKTVGLSALKGLGGFVAAMGIGSIANGFVPSPYTGLVGSIATVAGFEIAGRKIPKLADLDPQHAMSIGAAAAAIYQLLGLAVAHGIVPQSIAQYLPGLSAPAPVVVVTNGEAAAVTNGNGAGAYVQQRALYGMGRSPLEAELQHRLDMTEQGLAGGIFDHKTTLGEYDVLESAPPGTKVQAALADYEVYPPSMGTADVRAATAGLGAEVQEAFAGTRGMREYVQVPLGSLRDYVMTGGEVRSAMSPSTLEAISEAAQAITARRIREGRPVDEQFRRALAAQAMAIQNGDARDVSMAAPGPALTREAAPFPGMQVMVAGDIAGQPAPIDGFMDEQDGGIFA